VYITHAVGEVLLVYNIFESVCVWFTGLEGSNCVAMEEAEEREMADLIRLFWLSQSGRCQYVVLHESVCSLES